MKTSELPILANPTANTYLAVVDLDETDPTSQNKILLFPEGSTGEITPNEAITSFLVSFVPINGGFLCVENGEDALTDNRTWQYCFKSGSWRELPSAPTLQQYFLMN